MKQTAIVVNVDGKLMAEVLRSEACGQCNACGIKRGEKACFPLPPGDYKEGDRVTLALDAGKLSLASLLGYGVPLIGLLGGLYIGQALFASEGAQAICALVCLALGLVWLAVTEKKRRASGRFASCASHFDEGSKETGEGAHHS